jgi:hypothetical protein
MKSYILIILSFVAIANVKSQSQLNHSPKMHRNTDGLLYVNKNQPFYLFIGSDPNSKINSEKLESQSTAKYANPFYFDSEGLNTVRTPSQVDPITRKQVYPIADIVFEVYADGQAPITKIKFSNSPPSHKNKTQFYGPSVKVSFKANDETSGVENIYYSIDESPFQIYKDSLSFIEEKEYNLAYYSVDNVGNAEPIKRKTFAIDKTPPSATWKLSGNIDGNVASGNSAIEILAADNISGVKAIKYKIDNRPVKTYTQPIPLNLIPTGEHTFLFWAEDNVGNVSQNRAMDNDQNVYAFIVDDVAPTSSALVIGDQYPGKYLYVSSRSQCKLEGEDDLLGINKITYSFNNKTLDKLYNTPFYFKKTQGPQIVFFQAYDMVSNKSKIESLPVYLDNEEPTTGIDFKGPQFFNRDTLFINKTTEVVLLANDNASGIQKTEYQLKGKDWTIKNKFFLKEDGFHVISFTSTDNVNNKEQVKTSELIVDNEGPEIFVNFSIKPIRQISENGKQINVYPPFVKMYIGATDYQCGTGSIWYSIDGETKKRYTISGSPADQEMFKIEKTYKVVIDATDNLGNLKSKELFFKVSKK